MLGSTDARTLELLNMQKALPPTKRAINEALKAMALAQPAELDEALKAAASANKDDVDDDMNSARANNVWSKYPALQLAKVLVSVEELQALDPTRMVTAEPTGADYQHIVACVQVVRDHVAKQKLLTSYKKTTRAILDQLTELAQSEDSEITDGDKAAIVSSIETLNASLGSISLMSECREAVDTMVGKLRPLFGASEFSQLHAEDLFRWLTNGHHKSYKKLPEPDAIDKGLAALGAVFHGEGNDTQIRKMALGRINVIVAEAARVPLIPNHLLTPPSDEGAPRSTRRNSVGSLEIGKMNTALLSTGILKGRVKDALKAENAEGARKAATLYVCTEAVRKVGAYEIVKLLDAKVTAPEVVDQRKYLCACAKAIIGQYDHSPDAQMGLSALTGLGELVTFTASADLEVTGAIDAAADAALKQCEGELSHGARVKAALDESLGGSPKTTIVRKSHLLDPSPRQIAEEKAAEASRALEARKAPIRIILDFRSLRRSLDAIETKKTSANAAFTSLGDDASGRDETNIARLNTLATQAVRRVNFFEKRMQTLVDKDQSRAKEIKDSLEKSVTAAQREIEGITKALMQKDTDHFREKEKARKAAEKARPPVYRAY